MCAVFFSGRIIDFHRATGPGDSHPLLFDWVRHYFSQASRTSKLPPRLTTTSLPPLYLQHHGTITTGVVLLYLFLQNKGIKMAESETELTMLRQECESLTCPNAGHSRTIVGLEQKPNGKLCLLVLDPASSVSDTQRLLSSSTVSTAVRGIRKFPGSLKHKQYQLVVTQGVLSAQDREVRQLSDSRSPLEKVKRWWCQAATVL